MKEILSIVLILVAFAIGMLSLITSPCLYMYASLHWDTMVRWERVMMVGSIVACFTCYMTIFMGMFGILRVYTVFKRPL